MLNRLKIRPVMKLVRIGMSTAIAFSALAGYIFKNHALTWGSVAVFIGVLLLAGSASALNQYQERHLDKLMDRTKDRPLPSKEMKPGTAIVYFFVLGVFGTIVLYFFTTPVTATLGLLIFFGTMPFTHP
jgi:protoheme IX farnesyltransferase